MAKRKRALELVAHATRPARRSRRNRVNLFELAYQRIEDLIVNCELKPGRFLAMQDLQDVTGFSRTPVHQAVNRLAADTLIIIRPRHGVQIAPIDLARERVLLSLRRDIERFVIRLAAERASPSHRNQVLHVERLLRERHDTLTLGEFNALDRRIDTLILAPPASRSLSTRCGRCTRSSAASAGSITTTCRSGRPVRHDRPPPRDPDAVANRHVDRAVAASDALIDFLDGMFDAMEPGIDPRLLDCSLEPLLDA